MPSLKLGDTTPSRIYLGENQIERIYRDRQIVWPEIDASGPNGCLIRLFYSPQELGDSQSDADETYETVLCQADVSQVGRTMLTGSTYSGDTWIGHEGSGNITTFLVSEDNPHVLGEPDHGNIFGVWPWFTHESGGTTPTGFNLIARTDFIRTLGFFIPNLTSDFIANGYLVFGIDNGNVLILKASYGAATSDYTFSVTADNLVANHTDLDILIEPAGAEGRVITSDMSRIFDANPADSSDTLRSIHAIGYYDGLGPLMSVRWTPLSFPVSDVTRLSNWAYYNQWTTYGIGESARFLMSVSSVGAEEIYNHQLSVGAEGSAELTRGSSSIVSDLAIGRIRYDSTQRRLILNSSGAGHFRNWAIGDGADKSLFVAARGDIMELPFVATSEDPRDANPNTETGGSRFFRWDLRTTTPGAMAMHDHLVDFLAGDGYQLIFVVADKGTVVAV